jgi:hypothetical protein
MLSQKAILVCVCISLLISYQTRELLRQPLSADPDADLQRPRILVNGIMAIAFTWVLGPWFFPVTDKDVQTPVVAKGLAPSRAFGRFGALVAAPNKPFGGDAWEDDEDDTPSLTPLLLFLVAVGAGIWLLGRATSSGGAGGGDGGPGGLPLTTPPVEDVGEYVLRRYFKRPTNGPPPPRPDVDVLKGWPFAWKDATGKDHSFTEGYPYFSTSSGDSAFSIKADEVQKRIPRLLETDLQSAKRPHSSREWYKVIRLLRYHGEKNLSPEDQFRRFRAVLFPIMLLWLVTIIYDAQGASVTVFPYDVLEYDTDSKTLVFKDNPLFLDPLDLSSYNFLGAPDGRALFQRGKGVYVYDANGVDVRRADALVFATQRILYWLVDKWLSEEKQVYWLSNKLLTEDGQDIEEPWYFSSPAPLKRWDVVYDSLGFWRASKDKPWWVSGSSFWNRRPIWAMPRKTDQVELTGRPTVSQDPPA